MVIANGPSATVSPGRTVVIRSTPQPVAAKPSRVTPSPACASAVPQAERGSPQARATTAARPPRVPMRHAGSAKEPTTR